MKIALNSNERRMILDALLHDGYKDKIQEPKTKHFIGQIYKNLVEKISTIEAITQQEGKPEKAIAALKAHISFLTFKMPRMDKSEKEAAKEEILEYDEVIRYLEDL